MKRILLYFAFAITVLSSTVINAALVQYTYTGNPFDNTSYDYGTPTNFSLGFILDDSIVPNNGRFALQILNPTEDNTPFKAGSFGVVARNGWIYSPNGTISLDIDFDTDLRGNVSARWNIQVSSSSTVPNTGGHFDTYSSYGTQFDASLLQGSDQSHLLYRGGGYDLSNFNIPGTWTRSLVPVPIPPGFLLFGTVLGFFHFRSFFNNYKSGLLSPLT